MSSQARSLFVVALILLGTTQIQARVSVKATAKAVAGAGSGKTTAIVDATASSEGNGKNQLIASADAKDGGKAVTKVKSTAKKGAVVSTKVGSKAVGDGATAIVEGVVEGGYNSKVVGKGFATAIQKGDGVVIAKALVKAKAESEKASKDLSKAFAIAIATAIGDTGKDSATVAKTTASAIAQEGESRVAIGESLSKLIVDKGCEGVQDFIQKTEAEASSKGHQRAFFEAVNVDVNVIKCAFPDKCGNDGADKRGNCCGKDKESYKTGKCGTCKDGRCDFWMVWRNPSDIWTCDLADCKNKKPCICG